MTKKSSRAPTLNLGQSNFNNNSEVALSLNSPSNLSPRTPISPLSSAGSTYKGSTIRPVTARSALGSDKSISMHTDNGDAPLTPDITAIPPYPSSPRDTTKHGRDTSKSFFTNFKASRSTHRVNHSGNSISRPGEEKPTSRGSSKDRSAHDSRGQHNSSSSFSKPPAGKSKDGSLDDSSQTSQKNANGKANGDIDQAYTLTTKKSKPRFASLLTRSRSIRMDEPLSGGRAIAVRQPSNGLLRLEEISKEEAQAPLKTAPLPPERSFKDAMGSTVRNRSADRPPAEERNNYSRRERVHAGAMISSSFNQVTGSSLFNNIKQTSSGAADRLGRAGKGILGKITKSGSIHERDLVTDDNYVCSVINLPLVEQTRKTRISKRLEASKDKTEYWMPALPWRCIE
ncbi:hypothetical protein PRK78_005527 [Emydomyces testavorans]|uniref:Uncharacterized protein n=1 Tax=Emydomyces testavorans TaxID=2070801 RepID=A0AAF0IK48_9EURO|nr:hypothetical protein PRK78_005527 [Emydomyces testavorans]